MAARYIKIQRLYNIWLLFLLMIYLLATNTAFNGKSDNLTTTISESYGILADSPPIDLSTKSPSYREESLEYSTCRNFLKPQDLPSLREQSLLGESQEKKIIELRLYEVIHDVCLKKAQTVRGQGE